MQGGYRCHDRTTDRTYPAAPARDAYAGTIDGPREDGFTLVAVPEMRGELEPGKARLRPLIAVAACPVRQPPALMPAARLRP